MADRYWPAVTVAGATIDHRDGFHGLPAAKTWIALQLAEWADAPAIMPEQADALAELIEMVDAIDGDRPYWQRAITQTGFTARAMIRRG